MSLRLYDGRVQVAIVIAVVVEVVIGSLIVVGAVRCRLVVEVRGKDGRGSRGGRERLALDGQRGGGRWMRPIVARTLVAVVLGCVKRQGRWMLVVVVCRNRPILEGASRAVFVAGPSQARDRRGMRGGVRPAIRAAAAGSGQRRVRPVHGWQHASWFVAHHTPSCTKREGIYHGGEGIGGEKRVETNGSEHERGGRLR